MTRMLRTFAAIALVSALLGAGGASAVSSVDIIWKDTGTPGYSPSFVPASTTVTASVVLTADSVGVAGVFVTILFDTVELDFISGLETVAKVGMGNSFAPIIAGMTVDESAGKIFGFDSATLATGCISCTITLGTIKFHAVSVGGSPFEADVVATIEDNGIDGVFNDIGGDIVSVPASFGSAWIGTPEPGTALLVGLGLGAIAWSSRRQR